MRTFLLSTVALVSLGLSLPSIAQAELYPVFSKKTEEKKEEKKDEKKEDKKEEKTEGKDAVEKKEEKTSEDKAAGDKKEAEMPAKASEDKGANKYAPGSPEAVVVAKVNGQEITMGQVKEKMMSLPPQIQGAPFEKVFGPLVDHVINSELLTKAAKEKGLDKDPKVKTQQAECENMVLQKAYLEAEIEKRATEPLLQGHFDKLIKSIPKGEQEFRISVIAVSDEGTAKKLISELKAKPESFAELVKQSKDRSKEKGGDLGYLRKSEMPRGFEDEVAKAAPGAVLPKPIKSEKDYYVVKVVDKRPIELPTFGQVRGELKNMVAPHLALDVIKELRKGIKIERFDKDGKPLPEPKGDDKAAAGGLPGMATPGMSEEKAEKGPAPAA